MSFTGRPHRRAKGPSPSQSAETVDAFDFVEVTLAVTQPDAPNPFTQVAVTGEFAREDGAAVKVEGFCDATDGFPDVDTYRDLEFYLEADASVPASSGRTNETILEP